MSRSYRKSPFCGDRKDKFFKNYSNRIIRRSHKVSNIDEEPVKYNGGKYKRVFEAWTICDFWDRWTYNECKAFYHKYYPEYSDKDIEREWHKTMGK